MSYKGQSQNLERMNNIENGQNIHNMMVPYDAVLQNGLNCVHALSLSFPPSFFFVKLKEMGWGWG